MLSLAQSAQIWLAVIQFVIILIENRQQTARLADLACVVGARAAKATRYMLGASDAKPWPFREMDWRLQQQHRSQPQKGEEAHHIRHRGHESAGRQCRVNAEAVQ